MVTMYQHRYTVAFSVICSYFSCLHVYTFSIQHYTLLFFLKYRQWISFGEFSF